MGDHPEDGAQGAPMRRLQTAATRGATEIDLSSTQRRRVDVVFAQALELDGELRRAHIRRELRDEPELLEEALELLALSETPDDALAEEAGVCGPLMEEGWHGERETQLQGSVVGPYRLLRELGRGGMGVVYLAERDDGHFEQQVAIKVCAGIGGDTRRFELERQILASLNHPSIATLFDGGLTDDRRQYFVMELVEGERIDEYCDRRSLPIEARLHLFSKVAEAVQFAHRHLVVHRDLKPSNILVTPDGAVKLLDFGIAKLLRAGLKDGGLTHTMAGPMTPDYASPEQVRGEPISTAADIYQLGLLLYELLAGERAQRFEDHSASSLERVVCEQEVARPSAAVAASANSEACEARRTTASGLARKLRGDLDNIVLMALRKEPERRYASAGDLIDDLERYERGLPIQARPDTLTYRGAKLLRRHPVGVSAAVAFVVLAAAYAATVTYQARELAARQERVEIEARKARGVADFLVGLFEAADPVRSRGDALTAVELVEAGIDQARNDLGAEPELQAEMLRVLGKVSLNLSRFDRAHELMSEALVAQRQLHPSDHPDLATTLAARAEVLRLVDRVEDSAEHSREALAMRQRLYGESHRDVASSLSHLALATMALGEAEEAEVLLRRAVDVYRGLGPDHEAEMATVFNRLGMVLRRMKRYEEAASAHRQALAVRRRIFGPDHPEVGTSLNNLAVTLGSAGEYAEAEPLYRESIAITRKAVGDGHGLLGSPLHNLGNALRYLGRLDESEAALREALAVRRATLGEQHSSVAKSLSSLAETVAADGREEEAQALLRQAEIIAARP